MINIFFQEWAPLFPVLHRPTFLTLYEQYVADPEAVSDRKSLAMLNLVFGIAALSSHNVRAFLGFPVHVLIKFSREIFQKSLRLKPNGKPLLGHV